MMNNQTNILKVNISAGAFKKPLLFIAVILFLVLATALIVLPNMVSAETVTSTTTSGPTTVIVPIAGYYYYIDSAGGYHPCDFSHCATYMPYSKANEYNNYGYGTSYGSGLVYNPFSSTASNQYPIPQYIPYTKTGSIYPSNNYAVSPTINYENGFDTPVYPPAVYQPYEKVGSTIKVGQAKAIPYYSYNPNGMLNNAGGQGSIYSTGTNTYGTNPAVKSASTKGGFIMTGSSY